MISPEHDAAAVAAANSSDAGPATRTLCEDALARYGRRAPELQPQASAPDAPHCRELRQYGGRGHMR
jgi:hypothetical protein